MEDVSARKHRLPSEKYISKLWLDCLYWSFKWRFKDSLIGDTFSSKKTVLGKLGIVFLSIQKVSSEAFRVGINAEIPNPLKNFHEGYAIKFNLFMPGCTKSLKGALQFEESQVASDFKYDEVCSALNNAEIWTVRCVIKMYEKTYLENEASEKYSKLIKELIAQLKDTTLHATEWLLERPLKKLFTGRENERFASGKLDFVKRTVKYAEVISEKMRYEKGSKNYQPSTSQGIYLGYIYSGYCQSITREQAVDLYLDAQSYGLPYLVTECRDFMLLNLDDDEYLVSVLIASDMVSDSKLGRDAFSRFNANRERIMETNSWKILANEHYSVMQSILNTARLWILSIVHHQLDEIEIHQFNQNQSSDSDTELQRVLDEELTEDSSMEENSDEESECSEIETEGKTCYHIDSDSACSWVSQETEVEAMDKNLTMEELVAICSNK